MCSASPQGLFTMVVDEDWPVSTNTQTGKGEDVVTGRSCGVRMYTRVKAGY